MALHIETGVDGENAAHDYLQKLGYRILARNWRHKHLEMDFVATDQDILVFIEVKTLSGADYGLPYEAVNWKKQARLERAANIYISQNHYEGEIRFDIISIFVNGPGLFNIRHIRDAFWPE